MKTVFEKLEKGGDILISFDDMKDLPMDKVFNFNPNGTGQTETLFLKGPNSDLSFRTVIEKGTIFNSHKHDCVENIIVYKGRLVNMKTNEIIDRGYVHSFKKLESHHLKALEETICYIEFINPNK